MAMTATVLPTPAALAATVEATESVKLTPLDPLAAMEETLVAATVETLAAEGLAKASISPTLVMEVAEETTVAATQAMAAMEATTVVALAMAVMEVAQAMAVTANVQPTLNHGARTPGHLAMEEETKEDTAVDPVAQALAPAVATQAMAAMQATTAVALALAVMEVAQAMAVMAVALAMAVMAVALAMAVTANVQPTLNHGAQTPGHLVMEETLAATVEGH